LIKYWGKYENQIPANPSISYTLNHCRTNTTMEFSEGENFSVQTFLAGNEELKFAEKIEKYFKNIEQYLPWILKGKYVIRTENTFPHSSGIASSASGFGAIAKCLMQLDAIFSGNTSEEEALKKASFLARLGSGSACRSLYNGLVVWGNTKEVEGSSDLYAVQYPNDEIHPVFKKFNDWVLLIHEGEKSVSSTVGHGLMKTNPYAERRFQEAHENFAKLKNILKTGDLEGFIKLTEHEALTLHAMMMMSDPAFILMKTGTLEVINKIWDFRRITGLPLFFTLDAGANVHLLFPNDIESDKIKIFIQQELLPFTQKGGVVKDEMRF
ncbi:TPA: diphosphomevalonate decarboxylase, partial [Elizabethkingia anophelis]|nr:diphosphomevalonate decarboxylase [Elizabethkingia anophelis]HBN6796927.1 diphosphomevalonate decarboxylase [Elizabethkingia anophelis]